MALSSSLFKEDADYSMIRVFLFQDFIKFAKLHDNVFHIFRE